MAEQRIAAGPRLSPIPIPQQRVSMLEGASDLIEAAQGVERLRNETDQKIAASEARIEERQRDADDDALYIDRAVALEQSKGQLATSLHQLRQTLPAGGEAYHAKAREAIDRWRDDFMATIGNNDRVRQRLWQTVGVTAARLDVDEQAWSIDASARAQGDQFVTMTNTQANEIATGAGDPLQIYGDVRARGITTLDNLRAVDADKRSALRPQIEKRYFDALTDRMVADGREGELIARLKAGDFNDRIGDVGGTIANLERKAQGRQADAVASFQADARITLENVRAGVIVDPQQLAAMAAQADAAGKPELAHDLRNAVPIASANGQYASSGPAEIRAAQTALEQADPQWRTKPAAVALHNHLDSMYGRARDKVKSDVLGLWSANGNALTPIDIGNPASLKARAQQGMAAQQRYGGPLQLLRADEVEPLRRQFEQGGASDKAATIATFATAGADIGKAYMRQIAPAKPEYAWLTDLAAMHNASVGRGYMREALNGWEQLKADGALAAGDNGRKMQQAFDRELAPALRLADGPSRGAVMQVARGLYAARAVQAGVKDFDESLWSKAMRDALGGAADGTGGVGWTREGVPMVLPRGMSQRNVDWTIARTDGPSIVAAAGGNMPMWQGRRLTTGRLKAMRMVWKGDGLYAFQSSSGGYAGASSAPDQPFVLDIRRLARITENLRINPAPSAAEQRREDAAAALGATSWQGITGSRRAPPAPPAPPKPAALKDKGSQAARDALNWGSD